MLKPATSTPPAVAAFRANACCHRRTAVPPAPFPRCAALFGELRQTRAPTLNPQALLGAGARPLRPTEGRALRNARCPGRERPPIIR